MGWREWNHRSNQWSVDHPIRFVLFVGALFAVLQLAVVAWFDRPFYLPVFLLWVVAFPILIVARQRSLMRKAGNVPDEQRREGST